MTPSDPIVIVSAVRTPLGRFQGELSPLQASELAACLLAAQHNKLPEDAEWRTPWERNADHELVDYELGQMRKSIANMKSLGLM